MTTEAYLDLAVTYDRLVLLYNTTNRTAYQDTVKHTFLTYGRSGTLGMAQKRGGIRV